MALDHGARRPRGRRRPRRHAGHGARRTAPTVTTTATAHSSSPDESPSLITRAAASSSAVARGGRRLHQRRRASHDREVHCEWVEPRAARRVCAGDRATPSSSGSTPLPSIVLVALGFVVSLFICRGLYGAGELAARRASPNAVAPCSAPATRSSCEQVLPRPLYENVIVHARRPPDRQGRVLDQPARHRRHRQRRRPGRRSAGEWVYRNVDQRRGRRSGQRQRARPPAAPAARCSRVQSGKVNQYGALLFGAAAVGAARTRHSSTARGARPWTSSTTRTGC